MPIDTTCPECGAPYAKKLSLIYSEGKSTVHLTSQSTGTAKTIGKQKISTEGTSAGIQQSEISKAAAPPPTVPPFVLTSLDPGAGIAIFIMMAAIVLVPILAIFTPVTFKGAMSVWGVGMVAVLFVAALTKTKLTDEEKLAREKNERIEYEKRVAPQRKALDDWNNTFHCNACGHRFIPGERPTEKRAVV
jgi:hypothetical protein